MTRSPLSKSGFVAVLGRPNVGKSTLINALIGQKIAAVTPYPQTTRKRQMGILTMHDPDFNAQIVFVDTPGIHHPRHKLGALMNNNAIQTLDECDCALLIVDVSNPPTAEDEMIIELMNRLRREFPVILVLNKIDLASSDELLTNLESFQKIIPQSTPIQISALNSQGFSELIDAIIEKIPAGEPFFPDEQTTDLYEREITADLIREASLYLLRDEIPHGIAVRVDQYLERGDQGAYIEATMFLERESHKPIVIGDEGRMIKKIGIAARKEIEAMSGRKIFLKLKVKVRKNWRDDEAVLRQFGY